MIRCSLSIISRDRREDIVRDLALEPQYGGRNEDSLTVFMPKIKREKPEPKLVLADSTASSIIWKNLTLIQLKVAKGVVIEGKDYDDLAKELSDEFTKVDPEDVALAHRCTCDIVRSVSVTC